MRFSSFLAALAAAALALPAAAMNPEAKPEARPQGEAMVLGVYHFGGSETDLVSSAEDNIFAPERQTELERITDSLAEWGPDKIMIEARPDRQAEFDEKYRAYLDGEAELNGNERQQLGFRLAKKLGHDRVYAIDFHNGMDFEAMMTALDEAGQDELRAHFDASIAAIRAEQESPGWAQRTITDRLLEMNDPQWLDANHELYVDMAEAGTAENPVGAEQMSAWWGRNLHIYANAARLSEDGDKVLLVFGGGHAYTLRHYFGHSARFTLAEPAPYLTPAQ